jgi:hypothetical protein
VTAPTAVPIELILFPPPVPAGMNPLVLMSLTYALRTSHAWPASIEAVEVTPDVGGYRLVHGRHRVVAAMMAGRPTVQAVITGALPSEPVANLPGTPGTAAD